MLGRSRPNAARSPFSPTAIPIPASNPIADATRPITNASITTEDSTCRRLAPIARRSASSRVRCATMIENVLKMMKAPTNSAMKAKTSSAVRKNPRASFNCLDCSSATAALVTDSTPFGSTSASRCWSWTAVTSGSATTSISSNIPVLPRTSCAVGVSNMASVAPARLSASPKPAIPEIVNSRGGPWNKIRMVCPTARSYFFAVPASTATWSAPTGFSPERRTRPVLVLLQLTPSVGGPTPPIASSVAGSIICAYPKTPPSAVFTPGTSCTVGRSVSGIGSRSLPLPPPGPPCSGMNADVARTITSLPAEVCANRSSNALFMVSVNTNVPATKPTPSTMDSAVRIRRSLRPRRLLRVARNTPSALERLQPIQHTLGRRIAHLVHDVPVGQEDRPGPRNSPRSRHG